MNPVGERHYTYGAGTIGRPGAMGTHGRNALRRKSMGGSGG